MNPRHGIVLAGTIAAALGLLVPAAGAATAPRVPSWAATYAGPGAGYDQVNDMAVSPDGNRVIVSGYSDSAAGDRDVATVAYDAFTGSALWTERYDGVGHHDDGAAALAISPAGDRVFVTGSTGSSFTTPGHYLTIAYDLLTGTQLWVAEYMGPTNDDYASAIAISPDGRTVFVTGDSDATFCQRGDFATIAYDAGTGRQLWVARLKNSECGVGSPAAIRASPDGTRVFVTGFMLKDGFDYVTVAYDAAAGSRLWVNRYAPSTGGFDWATSLGVSPDGSRVYVTGTSSDPQEYDYATVAYNAFNGHQVWAARFDTPGGGDAQAQSLAVSTDGTRLYVTGWAYGPNDADVATVAYDAATGAQRWVAQYNGAANSWDYGYAVAVSPDGTSLFVAGASNGGSSTQSDVLTLSYRASTGRQKGVERFNGSANGLDQAYSLALNPNGTELYVAGITDDGADTEYDYLTLAYGHA